jgi:hypothetical protein
VVHRIGLHVTLRTFSVPTVKQAPDNSLSLLGNKLQPILCPYCEISSRQFSVPTVKQAPNNSLSLLGNKSQTILCPCWESNSGLSILQPGSLHCTAHGYGYETSLKFQSRSNQISEKCNREPHARMKLCRITTLLV